MEQQMKFLQITAENEADVQAFTALMYAYIAELDEHEKEPMPQDFKQKWIGSIIAMQGPKDRHLELCYLGEECIGFLYGKIDHADHRGYIKPGYGYVMGFYVKPQYRRKGYGKRMLAHLEQLFALNGAERMYLTADPVTGKPFWEALGFENTGEISPDNQLDIYEKAVSQIITSV